MNIHILEDDIEDQELIQDMLSEISSQNYKCVFTSTLKKGLSEMRKTKPDMVILDMGLPDSDGIEAIGKIQEIYPEMNIVILTGQDSEEKALKALSKGASDYLVKQKIDSDQLNKAIVYSLERKRVEERVLQAQKYEVLGQLAGSIAHDFNNQLAILRLLVISVQNEEGETERKDRYNEIEKVISNCQRLNDRILGFGRKQVTQRVPFDINKSIAESTKLLSRSF